MALVEVPRGTYENIPPNSFSSGDLLRIIANNTTRIERIHIAYFFIVVLPISGVLADFIEVVLLLFKPAGVFLKVLKLLRIIDNVVQRFNPIDAALLLMVLPEEPRKEAMKLLKRLQKDYLVE